MKKQFMALVSVSLLSAHAIAQPLSIERIFSDPNLAGQSPVKLKFSPDGSRVTYLQGKKEDYNRYDLWEYNLEAKQNENAV